MAASYKSLKEDFVSGLTGGNISEINYITAVAPVRFPHELHKLSSVCEEIIC